MRKFSYLAVAALVLTAFSSCNKSTGDWQEVAIESNQDSTSYAIGMDIATQFEKQSIDVNYMALVQGMKDYMDGNAIFDEAKQKEVMMAFQQQLQQKQQEEQTMKAQENKTKSNAFLEENAKKEGIMITESGLQYEIIEPGSADKPKETDEVTVNYKGMLIDGTIFDSSYDRGEPATFPLNRVIKGWTEGLQLIGKGGKIKLYIPSDLAYGDQGAGATIPGGSALVFEVELLDFNEAAEVDDPHDF